MTRHAKQATRKRFLMLNMIKTSSEVNGASSCYTLCARYLGNTFPRKNSRLRWRLGFRLRWQLAVGNQFLPLLVGLFALLRRPGGIVFDALTSRDEAIEMEAD